jgi:hypothetical protein
LQRLQRFSTPVPTRFDVLSRLRSVVDAVFHRDRFERAMTEEMRFHMDAYAEDLVRSGIPRDVASRRARVEFGPVDSIKEDARRARGLRRIDELRQDLHYARRQMVRSPGFTAVVVLTVALAVGANTAIFGAIDSVLIETLPVREPEQLVFLSAVGAGGERYGAPPYPWFEQIRARSSSFDGMAVFATDHLPVSIDGRPEQVLGQVASGSYFQLLGVRAAIGRTLTPDDEHLMSSRESTNRDVPLIDREHWPGHRGVAVVLRSGRCFREVDGHGTDLICLACGAFAVVNQFDRDAREITTPEEQLPVLMRV